MENFVHSNKVVKMMQITLYNFSEVKYNPGYRKELPYEKGNNDNEKVYCNDAGHRSVPVFADCLWRQERV